MSIVSYATFSKDDNIRYSGSSGGLFSEFANYIYGINGTVVGAAFDEDFYSVSHIITEKPSELSKLTTSKYLQSNFHVHKDIEEKLKNGKIVLCCATPCQIAGLKSYLKYDYDNLYTIDFICHGVPLQKVWKKYLEWQKQKNVGNIIDVNFRSKENGWNNYVFTILFESEKRYSNLYYNDFYMQLFLNNLSLNNGCFECKFKGNNRKSDITIGDFWGIEEEIPEINDDKGASFVSINTTKGKDLFEKIKNNLIHYEIEESQAYKHNPCALHPVDKPSKYDNFMEDVDKISFEELSKKYLPQSSIIQKLKKYKIFKLSIRIFKKIFRK